MKTIPIVLDSRATPFDVAVFLAVVLDSRATPFDVAVFLAVVLVVGGVGVAFGFPCVLLLAGGGAGSEPELKLVMKAAMQM